MKHNALYHDHDDWELLYSSSPPDLFKSMCPCFYVTFNIYFLCVFVMTPQRQFGSDKGLARNSISYPFPT